MSRSGLDPCPRRHVARRLRERKAKDRTPKHNGLKAYQPGHTHIDVKYPPCMANETSRGYFFVTINWASRWVFIAMYRHKTAATAQRFLDDLERACPIRSRTILTGMARRSLTAFLVCAGALQHDSRRLKRFAQLSVLNTGWPHQDRRKPTAWPSGSTAASRTCWKSCNFAQANGWCRRCTAKAGFTTTRLNNQFWAAKHPYTP